MNLTYAIDSHLLVQLLTGKEESRVAALLSAVRRNSLQLFLPTICFFEAYWILSTVYSYPKEQVLNAFTSLLIAEEIAAEEPDLLMRTLDKFASGDNDLVDVYMAEKAAQYQLPLLTWNKELYRGLGCEALAPEEL